MQTIYRSSGSGSDILFPYDKLGQADPHLFLIE